MVEFPRGSVLMNKLMEELWVVLKEQRRDLFDHLFEVRFVTTLSQQAVITLCYRQPLREGDRDKLSPQQTYIYTYIHTYAHTLIKRNVCCYLFPGWQVAAEAAALRLNAKIVGMYVCMYVYAYSFITTESGR